MKRSDEAEPKIRSCCEIRLLGTLLAVAADFASFDPIHVPVSRRLLLVTRAGEGGRTNWLKMFGRREIPGLRSRRREGWLWMREMQLLGACALWLLWLVWYLRRHGETIPESKVFTESERFSMRLRNERQRQARAVEFLNDLASSRCKVGSDWPRHRPKSSCGNFSLLTDGNGGMDNKKQAASPCDGPGDCTDCKLFDPRRRLGSKVGFEFCVGIPTAARPNNSTYLLQTVAALLHSFGVTPDGGGDGGDSENDRLAVFLYNSNIPGSAHRQAISGPLGCLLHVEGPSARLQNKDMVWYARETLAYSDVLTMADRANCNWTIVLEDDTILSSNLPARLRSMLGDKGMGRSDCGRNATAGVKLYHTTKYYGWSQSGEDMGMILIAWSVAFAFSSVAWFYVVLGEKDRVAVRVGARRRLRSWELSPAEIRLLFVGVTTSSVAVASLLLVGKQSLIPPFGPGVQPHRGAVGAQANLYARWAPTITHELPTIAAPTLV